MSHRIEAKVLEGNSNSNFIKFHLKNLRKKKFGVVTRAVYFPSKDGWQYVAIVGNGSRHIESNILPINADYTSLESETIVNMFKNRIKSIYSENQKGFFSKFKKTKPLQYVDLRYPSAKKYFFNSP